MRAWVEAQLAVGHHFLTCGQALLNNYFGAVAGTDLDNSRLNALVGLDNVDHLTGLSCLYSFGRHNDGVITLVERESHVDELPRPQHILLIIKRSFQVNCSSSSIHRVVYDRERAPETLARFVLRRSFHHQLAG